MFLQEVIAKTKAYSNLQLFYIPPYTSMSSVSDFCKENNIWLGAQNAHWELDGAFTGEVPAPILKASGAAFVMLGHVERRQLFGETDDMINKKVLAVSAAGLRVMLCVGESLAEKRAAAGNDAVKRQLKLNLAGFENWDTLSILYEPVWSIGTDGEAARPNYVASAMDNIRETLEQLANSSTSVPILYGGSVNAENCANYATLTQCAGLGVGRAAWQAKSFLNVLEKVLEARQEI